MHTMLFGCKPIVHIAKVVVKVLVEKAYILKDIAWHYHKISVQESHLIQFAIGGNQPFGGIASAIDGFVACFFFY